MASEEPQTVPEDNSAPPRRLTQDLPPDPRLTHNRSPAVIPPRGVGLCPLRADPGYPGQRDTHQSKEPRDSL